MSKNNKKSSAPIERTEASNRGISLKQLAEHTGLSPGTLSVVLNDTPRANAIPKETKKRIFDAAEKFNYRPNYFARSLRANKSFTVGVILSELVGSYCAIVLNGIESALTKKGYFYIATSHYHREDLLEHNPKMLIERQVDGIIAVDTQIRFKTDLPIVNVAGYEEIKGITNVVLNHETAAELGVGHLFDLGHRKIAVIRGQDFSTDSAVRWHSISEAAQKRGINIVENLTAKLEGDIGTPEIGYIAAQKLLSQDKTFTALFAFNDVSAIGAIAALQEAGFRVPEDVSVLGFDDIYAAKYHNPALTTIRQPLSEMGMIAGQALLSKILNSENLSEAPTTITVEPKLEVRKSTSYCRN